MYYICGMENAFEWHKENDGRKKSPPVIDLSEIEGDDWWLSHYAIIYKSHADEESNEDSKEKALQHYKVSLSLIESKKEINEDDKCLLYSIKQSINNLDHEKTKK